MPSHKYLLYTQQHGLCFYCGEAVTYTAATQDHVIPVASGGKGNIANKVMACQPCNLMKGKLPLAAFILRCEQITYHLNRTNLLL